jgi:hypothetical protein
VHIVDGCPRSGSTEARARARPRASWAPATRRTWPQHLLEDRPGVAAWIDDFYDYRARRPAMTFIEHHYEQYDAPRLVVRLMHDQHGTPYLLLHGPEPDMHWEGFASAVRAVVEHFGVRLTVAMGAVPMAVPHTRPVMLTNHATSPELLIQENVWKGQIRIPASAQSLLELRLGEWGHAAMGFVAHIPHMARFKYPNAAVGLSRRSPCSPGCSGPRAAARRGRGEDGRDRGRSRTPRRSATWSSGWAT